MPPKKRKADASDDEKTPKKKKMTKLEKAAARAQAAQWAKERMLEKQRKASTPAKRAPAVATASSSTVAQKRPPPSHQENNNNVLKSPPPFKSPVRKTNAALKPQAVENGHSQQRKSKDAHSPVLAIPQAPAPPRRQKWMPMWILSILCFFLMANVVLSGLLVLEKVNHQTTLWQLEQDETDPLPEKATNDDSTDDDLTVVVEALKARVADLESQKRGLQEEFTELLEELMEERASHN